MSDEQDKTRTAPGVKFSSFTKVEPEDGNPVEVVGLRDGTNVRATLTTDLIETNPNQFRDRSGRFTKEPEEVGGLTNQRSVNEFLWKNIQDGIAEQEVIQDKVTSLEGAVGEHSLMFTMDEISGPQFSITDGMSNQSSLSEASFITLPSVDRKGNTIALDRISQGDVLRMGDGLGEFTELRIDGEPEGNTFPFNQISGDMDRLSDAIPYDFTVFVAFDPAGLATTDYVDSQDEKKLNKSGGTITGGIDIKMPRGTSAQNSFRIAGRVDGKESFLLKDYQRKDTDDTKSDYINYYGGSSADTCIMNKGQIAKLIEEATSSSVTTWKYVPDDTSPEDGEFSWRVSGNYTILVMANRTSDGILWVHGHGREESLEFGDSFFVSVSQSDGNFNLIADVDDFEFSRKNKPNTHVYLDDSEWEIDLVEGQRYCIRIPGLLPLVKF